MFSIYLSILLLVQCVTSHFSSKVVLNAADKWQPQGRTVAGGHGPGDALNQLNASYGVFVDANLNVFVSDYLNNRIVKWEKDATEGSIYIGGGCGINPQDHLCYPSALTFNNQGILFVTVQNDSNGAVISYEKEAATREIFISTNSSLYGIVWDFKEEYLYLGHHREHRVVKYSKNGAFMGVVAGGNERGSGLHQLDYPRGVAVDENGTVYVADSNNHRLMKWPVNATEGINIFGGNGAGNRTDQLNTPAALIRDRNGTIYVVDERNNRIMSIAEGNPFGTIIAGGNQQLNSPIYLAFNQRGDLYVSDLNNYRVQMFEKVENPSSNANINIIRFASQNLVLFFVSCFVCSYASFM